MRPQTMTVLALLCLAGSSARADAPRCAGVRATPTSSDVPAPSRGPIPSEVLALPTRAAAQVPPWSARDASQPTGIALLSAGQWILARDGRWLWLAHDRGPERATPSFVGDYRYTYYPAIGWRRVVTSNRLDPALFAHSPFEEFGALGGTPALGFESARTP
jgi:hypothetical protein